MSEPIRDHWAAICGVWVQPDGTVIDLWPMRALIEASRAAAYPAPVEVWCSRCDQPSVAERTVSDGSRTYRAAYCGDCLANLERSSQAARNHARRATR